MLFVIISQSSNRTDSYFKKGILSLLFFFLSLSNINVFEVLRAETSIHVLVAGVVVN